MRHRLTIGSLLALALVILVYARSSNLPAQGAQAGDEQAIRKATDTYVEGFNKGDVDLLLSVWAPDAEYIDDAGVSTKGKTALAAMYRKVLQEYKGVKAAVKTTAIRLLKDDIAMQDGQSLLTLASGDVDATPFSTLWMKKDGKWLIYVVHDLSAPVDTAEKTAAGVKDLAWLIGDWASEDKDMKTSITGRWMKGQKFLAVDFSVKSKGEEVLTLTQIIGWDPNGSRPHSWVFDSRGGFGEGAWTREGNSWVVQTSGITSDGRQGSGKMIWTYVDNDQFIHEAVDRNLDGQPLPDRKTKYQRVK